MALRAVEKVTLGYLALTVLLIGVRGSHIPGVPGLLLTRLVVAGVVALFASGRMPRGLAWARDWYPLVLAVVFYSEMDQLNRAFARGFYDFYVIDWEQRVFHGQPSITLRQQFPQLWLSEYLHFAYFSYYLLVPVLGVMLYARGKRTEFRDSIAATATTFFVCMGLFIVFPVAGPYYMYVQADPHKVGRFMAPIVHWVLHRGASIGTAFPSSHVAVSMTVLFSAWVADRRAFWVLLTLVPALAVGAVYGGFHYAIDTVAGFGVAVLITYLMLGRPGWARSDRPSTALADSAAHPL